MKKPSITLLPSDFIVPGGLLYPCFCPQCISKKHRTRTLLQPLNDFLAPRIGAQISWLQSGNSSDGLLELGTTMPNRKHTGRNTVTLRSAPAIEVRRNRMLAFLWRCMMTPPQADDYITRSDTQLWLPVPPSNFEGHALADPLITAIRDRLSIAGFPKALDDERLGFWPWSTPAAIAARILAGTTEEAFPGTKYARDFADRCSADDAREDEHPTVRKVAVRVAFQPDPRDVWPWVPRWGPATKLPSENGQTPPCHPIDEPLRRWWNFNGPLLRPDAFAADPAYTTRHARLLEQRFAMPMMTKPHPLERHAPYIRPRSVM
jgi:hypothetical protein